MRSAAAHTGELAAPGKGWRVCSGLWESTAWPERLPHCGSGTQRRSQIKKQNHKCCSCQASLAIQVQGAPVRPGGVGAERCGECRSVRAQTPEERKLFRRHWPSNAGSENRRGVRCCSPEPGCEAGLWACRGPEGRGRPPRCPGACPGCGLTCLWLFSPPLAFRQEAHSLVSKQEFLPSGPCPNANMVFNFVPSVWTVPGPDPQARLAQEGAETPSFLWPLSLSLPLGGSGCRCLAGPDAGDQVGPGKPSQAPAPRSSFLSTGLPFSRNQTHFNLRALLSTCPFGPDAMGEGPVPRQPACSPQETALLGPGTLLASSSSRGSKAICAGTLNGNHTSSCCSESWGGVQDGVQWVWATKAVQGREDAGHTPARQAVGTPPLSLAPRTLPWDCAASHSRAGGPMPPTACFPP